MRLTASLDGVPDTFELRQQLTIEQIPLSPLAEPGTLRAYVKAADGTLSVPKAWGLANYGSRYMIDEQTPFVRVAQKALTIEALRPHQEEAIEAIEAEFFRDERGGGGVLVLPCGYGKTVTAIALAVKLRMPTLIVCHTDVLIQQWRAAIAQYCPDAKIGQIQQDAFDVQGCDFVVASLKSVATRTYPPHGCGIMVVDECHHIVALQLSAAVAKVGTRYRLGLSATPERPDGLSEFLQWSFGHVLYEVKRSQRDDLRAFGIHLESGPVYDKTVRKAGEDVTNIAGMISLCTDFNKPRAVARQEIAAAWVRLCVSKRRKVLVLSDRLALLDDLATRLGDITHGFITGKAKKKEREAAKDATVLLATYGTVAEGFDCPSLDTLLLLTPRSGEAVITQVVGRLFRNGGRSPLVVDLVDRVGVFQNMFRKRMRLYKQMGGSVTQYDENREERIFQ